MIGVTFKNPIITEGIIEFHPENWKWISHHRNVTYRIY